MGIEVDVPVARRQVRSVAAVPFIRHEAHRSGFDGDERCAHGCEHVDPVVEAAPAWAVAVGVRGATHGALERSSAGVRDDLAAATTGGGATTAATTGWGTATAAGRRRNGLRGAKTGEFRRTGQCGCGLQAGGAGRCRSRGDCWW